MLTIRKAILEDMLQYFEWANDPEVRSASFHSQTITLPEHEAWFERKIKDPGSYLFIFESGDEKAGQVRIEVTDRAIIGISIDKNFRGKKLAAIMLKMALEKFRVKSQAPVYAYIRKDNAASVKSFINAGFVYLTEDKVNDVDCFVYISL